VILSFLTQGRALPNHLLVPSLLLAFNAAEDWAAYK
jgi:hypothetical protein